MERRAPHREIGFGIVFVRAGVRACVRVCVCVVFSGCVLLVCWLCCVCWLLLVCWLRAVGVVGCVFSVVLVVGLLGVRCVVGVLFVGRCWGVNDINEIVFARSSANVASLSRGTGQNASIPTHRP